MELRYIGHMSFKITKHLQKLTLYKRGDVIIYNVYDSKGQFIDGHGEIFTGEGGNRATLQSSSSYGVSYQGSYTYAYYQKIYKGKGYTIDRDYYREVE